MNADPSNTSIVEACALSHTPRNGLKSLRLGVFGALFAIAATLMASLHPVHAEEAQQDVQSAPSFVDNFSNFDRSRWFVSE
ncbi:1,3-beta-glucanase, partial [Mesorhizobium sp. M4B.F.Ca.ET.172.01.1.1]